MALNQVSRQLIQQKGDFNATTLEGKAASYFLPANHASARFSWSGSYISIDNGGNNARVAYADRTDSAVNSDRIVGMQVRAGNYSSGAEGYITFGTV